MLFQFGGFLFPLLPRFLVSTPRGDFLQIQADPLFSFPRMLLSRGDRRSVYRPDVARVVAKARCFTVLTGKTAPRKTILSVFGRLGRHSESPRTIGPGSTFPPSSAQPSRAKSRGGFHEDCSVCGLEIAGWVYENNAHFRLDSTWARHSTTSQSSSALATKIGSKQSGTRLLYPFVWVKPIFERDWNRELETRDRLGAMRDT
ncbi:hypothetical protein K438DRAFT_1936191 [Mycena galopus ATCC 62051]|nr:hypothetical protein K438DRAFT_1936191 [Mycena galopus ATCC 62051]